jgi:hypothetical protein
MKAVPFFRYAIVVAALSFIVAGFGCKKSNTDNKTRLWRHFRYHSVATYDSFNNVLTQSEDTLGNNEQFWISGLGGDLVIVKDISFTNKFVFGEHLEYSFANGHFMGGALKYYPANDSIYFTVNEHYGPTATPIAPTAPYKIEVWNDSYHTY